MSFLSGWTPDLSERRRWRALGASDPYWAVCTDEQYRTVNLSAGARDEFFRSGEREVSLTFEAVERHVHAGFAPETVIDYGSGVGRLAIPLARRARAVIGIDISDTMIAEARGNAAERGVANVTFATPDALRDMPPDAVDFVHSYIVFQHIPPAGGLAITRELLRVLKPGGVGALHYTFSRQASLVRRLVHPLRRLFPPLNVAVNALQGRRLLEPMIPVHEYDLETLTGILNANRCAPAHSMSTNHGGWIGAMLLFRKASHS